LTFVVFELEIIFLKSTLNYKLDGKMGSQCRNFANFAERNRVSQSAIGKRNIEFFIFFYFFIFFAMYSIW